ncbi:hypothetical protein [Micromonospora sp. CPCC 206061]|uniref:hypothetical protein n=1 Tax=Micromonospora sp. CPCC 206061 TaxID=3122410 RepID=UPI002FF4139D
MSRARVDAPADTLGALLGALSRLGAAVEAPAVRGGEVTVEAVLPSASVPRLQRELPGLTSGEACSTRRTRVTNPCGVGPHAAGRSASNGVQRCPTASKMADPDHESAATIAPLLPNQEHCDPQQGRDS